MTKSYKRMWGRVFLIWLAVLLLNISTMFIFPDSYSAIEKGDGYISFIFSLQVGAVLIWLIVFTLHPLILSTNTTLSVRLSKNLALQFCCFLIALFTSSIIYWVGSPLWWILFSFVGIVAPADESVKMRGGFLMLTVIPLLFYMHREILKPKDDDEEEEDSLCAAQAEVSCKGKGNSFYMNNKETILMMSVIWFSCLLFELFMSYGGLISWSLRFALFCGISFVARFMYGQGAKIKKYIVPLSFLFAYSIVSVTMYTSPSLMFLDVLGAYEMLHKEGITLNSLFFYCLPGTLTALALFYLHMTIMKRDG